MTYYYFPGCSLKGLAAEYDRSVQTLCRCLGLDLKEAPDWVCCGATPAHATNHLLSIALPAITLGHVAQASTGASAEGNGEPTVVTACAACYSRLRTANHEIQHDPLLMARVQEATGIPYEGGLQVRHLMDVLHEDVGAEAIRSRVKRSLEGLKVACYYGCLLVRPPKVVAFDDPEHPHFMDDLLAATGATCVDWPYKTECCGAAFGLSRPDVVCKLANDILSEARDAGADAIAVACPLCQNNLDLRQSDVARKYGTRYDLPILYFTQILGWALGASAKELGLERLIVSPKAVLEKATATAPA